ncbi:hypothetical protein ABPG72_013364 [Tetrahymena utriculariae]
MTNFIIGVDVGGTNTDSVLVRAENMQIICKQKAFTTPDVTTGIANSIRQMLYQCPFDLDKSSVFAIIIGTTHFINAILQKGYKNSTEKLNKVAVIRFCGPQSLDFYPFCQIENSDLLQRIQGPSYILNGGFYFDGEKEYTKMNEKEIIKSLEDIIAQDIHNLVISGVYSTMNNSQEAKARQIVQEECKKRNYNISITLTHEICKKDGLLERENAAIINECLKYLSSATFQGYRKALDDLGFVNTPLFISHNDGSFMSAQAAQVNPIFTFSASIINSLKGGSQLYNEKDAIVVDIGGTSTDIAVMSKGIPRTASKFMEVNGIILNFRMPLVHTIALGGGSIVQVGRDENQKVTLTIQKESVAFRLLQSAISFEGGSILCNTDFAIYRDGFLEASIPGADKKRFVNYLQGQGFNLQEIDQLVELHRKQLTEKLTSEIETLITDSSQKRKILLVGGGACLVDSKYLEEATQGVCEVLKLLPNQDVANALGSTLTDVTEIFEKEVFIQPNQTEQQLIQDIEAKLIDQAKQNGAQEPVEVVEIISNEVSYSQNKNQKKLYIKVKGKFSWDKCPPSFREVSKLDQMFSLDPSKTAQKANPKINFVFKKPEIPKLKLDNGSWKPQTVINNIEDFKNLAWGCAVLGSGGGGSVEKSVLIGQRLFQERKKPLILYDPDSMKDEDLLCIVGHYGAPTIFQESGFTIHELFNSFKALNQFVGNKINCLGCVEVGGCNALACIILGLASDIPVFDCNLMCRAFPELCDILPIIHKQSPLPLAFGDSKNNRYLIDDAYLSNPPLHEEFQNLEGLLRDWVVKHFGMMGSIACQVSNREFIQKYYFKGGYQQALKIGEALHQGINIHQKPVEKVIEENLTKVVPHSKVIIKGKIIQSIRRKQGGYDFGKVIIKGTLYNQNEKQERYVSIKYKNEFLYAEEVRLDEQTQQFVSGQPLVMTPDLITLLDEYKGTVIHSEDVCYGLRAIVIALPVDPKFTTPEALKVIGPPAMGIDINIPYKPYY